MNKIGNIQYFETLPSTNDYIKESLIDMSIGDIVHAFHQTKGRGRQGNLWQSKSGENLTFSIYDQINNFDTNHHFINTCVSLVKTLKAFNDTSATIKLPNDIMVENKKIAGILIETLQEDATIHVIVGIGLNINQILLGPLNEKDTSLKSIHQKDFVKEEVLKVFIEQYNSHSNHEYESLFKDFKSFLNLDRLYAYFQGETALVEDIDEAFMCKFNNDWLPCSVLDFKINYNNYK